LLPFDSIRNGTGSPGVPQIQVRHAGKGGQMDWARGVSTATLKNITGVVVLTALFYAPFGFSVALTFIVSGLGLIALTLSGPKSPLPLEGVPFVVFAGFAVMSTLWSNVPAVTLWSSLELFATMLIAIWVPVALRPRVILLTLFLCASVMALQCMPDFLLSISTGRPMRGIFASKNANASEAEIWGFISSYILLDKEFRFLARILAGVSVIVALVFIYASHAMGSTVSIGLFFALIGLGLGYRSVPPRLRLTALVAVAPILIAAVALLPDLKAGWTEFQTSVLQKDSTLTGRTAIWDTAERVSQEYPWLGVGFGAFWIPGNPYAEGIWQSFGITGRSGFNFHNVFVEYRVALGFVGMVSIALLYVYVGAVAIYNFLRRPSVFTIFVFSCLTCLYIHSFSEDGIGSAFNTETVFWICIPRMLQVAHRRPLQASRRPLLSGDVADGRQAGNALGAETSARLS
jgi:exopolysaccharide production protein ExoQ